MIIGLAGEKESGKDTIGAYLIKTHGFERKAFADPLKKSVAALFSIPFSDVDKLKADSKIRVAIGYEDSFNHIVPAYTVLTFREILERKGTEGGRDIFGTDFWVDQTLPVTGYYPGRAIVVTDCRFNNEAARIKELGGFVVRVIRPGADGGGHASNTIDFECDYTIYNNSTLEELYTRIETMLTLQMWQTANE